MKRDYDQIVIGLGGIGSAAAYWLARRGAHVLGIEQFELGHVRGASQDHSRIIRLSYHTPGYVRLAQRAYRAWESLEDDSGERVIIRTGGLDFEPAGSRQPIDDNITSLQQCGVPFELLDTSQLMHRWPQLRLADGTRGLFQPDAGIAAAARGNAAHQRMARAHGATLLDQTPVTAIQPLDGEVAVVTDAATFRCQQVLIAADAWTNQLLVPLGIQLPLRVTQEQVSYFAAPPAFAPERFPVWIWMDEPSYYGIPIYGEPGIKIGEDIGGAEVSATSRTFEPDPRVQERAEAFLDRVMPSAHGRLLLTKTCLYTMPPDRNFTIDRLPQYPNVLLAQGAAHAYKFASLIGLILTELALDGSTESDISEFGVARLLRN